MNRSIFYYIYGFLNGGQCQNHTAKKGGCVFYCVKNKGHFGKCKQSDGTTIKTEVKAT